MRLSRLTTIVVLVAAAAACTKNNPDYCPEAGQTKSCKAADAAVDHHVIEGGSDAGDAADVSDAPGDGADAAPETKPPICATDDNCATADAGTPACDTSGDAGARCVECTANKHCKGAKPICDTVHDKCVECTGVDPANECRTGSVNVCKTASQTCVECVDSKTCGTTKPVCDKGTNVCRPCVADSECAGIGPGICVDFDGHCATAAEVITLQGGAGCTPSGKTFCAGTDAVNALDADHTVLLVKGPDPVGMLSPPASAPAKALIVGQGGALIAAGAGDAAGIHLAGAHKFWVRDLKLSGGTVGVLADTGAELHLTRCVVTMNGKGGIKTSNASFDITNTIVAANGAGTDTGGVVWGGVRLGDVPQADSTRFENNTVVGNLATGVSCFNTYVVAGSIVYQNTSANIAGCAATVPCCGAADPDPLLDASYHLKSGSPCIDKIAATNMSLTVDIDGQPRPAPPSGLLDCGADELVK